MIKMAQKMWTKMMKFSKIQFTYSSKKKTKLKARFFKFLESNCSESKRKTSIILILIRIKRPAMTFLVSTILKKPCAHFPTDQKRCAFLSKRVKIGGSWMAIRKTRANTAAYTDLRFKRPAKKKFSKAIKVCLMWPFGSCSLMLMTPGYIQNRILVSNFI